jgi:hypothetical protein
MRIPFCIRPVTAVLVASFAGSCSAFEDPTPEMISVHIADTANTPVEVVYSTQFIAAVNELGVTEVQIFSSDTVYQALPVDRVMDISVDRRLFVQLTPQVPDTTRVEVRIDVDDRNILSDSGDVIASSPWRFAYLFNQKVTRKVDVVF